MAARGPRIGSSRLTPYRRRMGRDDHIIEAIRISEEFRERNPEAAAIQDRWKNGEITGVEAEKQIEELHERGLR